MFVILSTDKTNNSNVRVDRKKWCLLFIFLSLNLETFYITLFTDLRSSVQGIPPLLANAWALIVSIRDLRPRWLSPKIPPNLRAQYAFASGESYTPPKRRKVNTSLPDWKPVSHRNGFKFLFAIKKFFSTKLTVSEIQGRGNAQDYQ